MKNLVLEKAFAALHAVLASPGPITLKAMSEKLGLNISTLSRITADLAEAGFIEKSGYRSFVPSLGSVIAGAAAVRRFPFLRQASELISVRTSGLGIGGSLHCLWNDYPVVLFRSGGGAEGFLPFAEALENSDAAVVLLARHYGDEAAREVFRKRSSGDSRGEELFMRRLNEARNGEQLIRREVGRRWSITAPVTAGGRVYALTFFGVNPERFNFDSLALEFSLLVGKIRAL